MKRLERLLVGLTFGILTTNTSPAEARYKGYREINNQLFARILHPNSQELIFIFRDDFEDPSGSIANLLLPLMGGYESGGNNEFKNGTPNELNATVWHLALEMLGADIAGVCEGRNRQAYSQNFKDVVLSLCQKSRGEAFDEILLSKFWALLVAYDAPPEEYLYWRDFLNAEYQDAEPDRFLAAMTFAAGFSADFLLSKRN